MAHTTLFEISCEGSYCLFSTDLSNSSGLGKLSGSSASLNKPANRSRSGSMQSVESINIIHGSESDLAIRHLFDQVCI